MVSNNLPERPSLRGNLGNRSAVACRRWLLNSLTDDGPDTLVLGCVLLQPVKLRIANVSRMDRRRAATDKTRENRYIRANCRRFEEPQCGMAQH
jgi:hypothetical protein